MPTPLLVIRREQMQALGAAMRQGFVARLADWLRVQRPEACAALSDAELAAQVEPAIDRAAACGFVAESDVARYVLTGFTIGAAFEDDPRHAWALPLLDARSSRRASFRSEDLLAGAEARAAGAR